MVSMWKRCFRRVCQACWHSIQFNSILTSIVLPEACQKIVQNQGSDSSLAALPRPNTPSFGFYRQLPASSGSAVSSHQPSQPSNGISSNRPIITSPTHSMPAIPHSNQQTIQSNNSQLKSHPKPNQNNNKNNLFNQKPSESGPLPPTRVESKVNESKVAHNSLKPVSEQPMLVHKETKDMPTPSSTPTTARKTRRRSNLFPPLSNKKHLEDKYKNGELGSGRAIPVRIMTIDSGFNVMALLFVCS